MLKAREIIAVRHIALSALKVLFLTLHTFSLCVCHWLKQLWKSSVLS